MKELKLPISKEKNIINEELQELITVANQYEISPADEQALLSEIRKGNHLAIEGLVKASSSMIYKIIGSHPSNKHSIQQQFTFAQKHLRQLALFELNSTKRECYLRFQVHYVRQALLQMEM